MLTKEDEEEEEDGFLLRVPLASGRRSRTQNVTDAEYRPCFMGK